MDDGTELCTACGFCCDGTLVGVVRLDEAEVATMTRLGLPVARAGALRLLEQPCAALAGTRCRVYGDRPARCAAFRCRLLAELEAGAVTREEALAVVAHARSLEGEARADVLEARFRRA